MIGLLADENVAFALIVGLIQRVPGVGIKTTLELGLDGMPDSDLLEWAAANNRVVVTHDRKTMPDAAYARIADGAPMPGVILVRAGYTLRTLLDELELALRCLDESDFANHVIRIPLR